jgi:hypothetical protein
MTSEELRCSANKKTIPSIWGDSRPKISTTLISNFPLTPTKRRINLTPYKISQALSELIQAKKFPSKRVNN